jgi:hypothetical protein
MVTEQTQTLKSFWQIKVNNFKQLFINVILSNFGNFERKILLEDNSSYIKISSKVKWQLQSP